MAPNDNPNAGILINHMIQFAGTKDDVDDIRKLEQEWGSKLISAQLKNIRCKSKIQNRRILELLKDLVEETGGYQYCWGSSVIQEQVNKMRQEKYNSEEEEGYEATIGGQEFIEIVQKGRKSGPSTDFKNKTVQIHEENYTGERFKISWSWEMKRHLLELFLREGTDLKTTSKANIKNSSQIS